MSHMMQRVEGVPELGSGTSDSDLFIENEKIFPSPWAMTADTLGQGAPNSLPSLFLIPMRYASPSKRNAYFSAAGLRDLRIT